MKSGALIAAGVSVAFVALGVGGCSAPDPGAVVFTPHGNGPTSSGQTPPPNPGASGNPQPSGDAGSPLEGGPIVSGDAAVDSGTSAIFSGAFSAGNQPQTTAAQNHANRGQGVVPSKDVNCMTCHSANGPGHQFMFAGSIYTDVNATTGAANVEVRVVDNAGTGISTYSDADGNFWLVSNTPVPLPGQSGARDANGHTQIMPQALADPGCNSCHNGTVQPALHLP